MVCALPSVSARCLAGRLTIKVFGAGEFVPPLEVFDSVSSGAAEVGHATSYYWQGKDPSFHFYTGVPFGLTQIEHAAWLRFGGGQELWERAYEPFNVLPFYAGASGTQAGGWFAKELKSLDDLKGLKMRIAGSGGRGAASPWCLGHHATGNGHLYCSSERNH